MTVKPGTRIGSYEVTATLGEGGMGVVVRARDSALQRDVALKLLPDRFTSDSDRLLRFRREAQILASLSHPNIAQVYGLEQAGDSSCIVMELVEGETLADRISRGTIPFDETIDIARQIVAALDAAHEKGIVHRDLKPANIKLAPDGKVKVLDFGLAKAVSSEAADANISQSPTMMTGTVGMILGTAAYMAPEQARGRAVDKRADVWAFGCVLYEMLTGTRAFDGADVTEILGAIIHKEPDWQRIPVRARLLVRRCLEKDVSKRLRDIGDAMALIDGTSVVPAETASPSRLLRLGWPAAALFAAAALVVGALYVAKDSPPEPAVMTFEVPAPTDTEFDAINPSLSPNGRHLVFAARGKDNISRLWIRNMDSLQAHPLNGTEGISGAPIWSPDSGSFAFGVGNELKKIELAGSSVRTLGTSKTPVGSGSWSKEDVIVFGGRGAGGLQQIPSSGGTAQALTIASRGFHTFPWFLPDGRRFLYLVTAPLSIHIGSLDSKPEEQSNAPLLTGTSDAMYLPGPDPFVGHLLYTRNATLMAHPFDANLLQVSGEPVPIADRIAAPNPILSFFSISMNGVLSYRSGDGLARTLVLRDRKGTDTPIASDPLDARNPRLSPDGKRVALIVGGDLWVFDLGGRPPIKLTFGREAATPLWTKDGKRLIFETNTVDPEFQGARGQSVNSGSLLSVAADGSNPALERASPEGHFHAYGWSPADELIAVKYGEGGRNTDIVKMSPAEKAQVLPVVQTPAPEGGSGMSLSSDSRWLAYSADTTGAFEIWVRAFGEAGAPIRVSPNGGSDPVWSRNGRELFYIQGSRLMAVEVDTRSGFTFKSPVSLFDIAPEAGTQPSAYDVTEDGRFVFLRSSTGVSTPVTLVFDWTSKLKKKTE